MTGMRARSAWGILLIGASACAADTGVPSPESRPNVVLIVADDLGHGDVGFTGAKDIQTPRIDSLAADGARFTDFYANSPLCSPTRAALLSGRYPQEAGVWKGVPTREKKEKKAAKGKDGGKAEKKAARKGELDDEEGFERDDLHVAHDLKLLPQILKEAGYATGMFGKWHLGGASPNLPNDRGFDRFFGFLSGSSKYGPKHGPTQRLDGKPYDEEGHLTDLFTRHACDFIRANRDRSFFVYLPYNAPHGPIDNAAGLLPDRVKAAAARGLAPKRADYAAVVEHLDDGIGRVLALLDELKLAERTLVVFTSDNGANCDKYAGSNAPFRGEKGQTWEGGIRVPCAVRLPGRIPKGTVSRSVSTTMDLFSTVLDYAGLPLPEKTRGVSLKGDLESGGQKPLPERTLFFELKGKVAARRGNWKLVGDVSAKEHRKGGMGIDGLALFDLAADPGETTDLAQKYPEILDGLKKELDAWLAEIPSRRGSR